MEPDPSTIVVATSPPPQPPKKNKKRSSSNRSSSSSTTTTTTIGPYIPNSGPPLPTLSLMQPLNGTTGYIIDRLMLPRRLPNHRPPHNQQTIAVYYVGYADRPLERALVPYSEILEHVSPRELERWEEGFEERRAAFVREETRRRDKEREAELANTKRVTRGMRRKALAELESERGDEGDSGAVREDGGL